MRLWKVKTRADITVETNWFGYKTTELMSFTYGTKFIYAETLSDARLRYGDLFFNPAEDGYNKKSLKEAFYQFESMSSNMNFCLPFNSKITHTHEYIYVSEQAVKENIDVVRKLSSADDFKNWLMDDSKNEIIKYNDDYDGTPFI